MRNVSSVTAAFSQYADGSIDSVGAYFYKVAAIENGERSYTAATSALNTGLTPALPNMPTGCKPWDPSMNDGQGGTVVTWQDNSLNEDSFTIIRTNADGSTQQLTAPANAEKIEESEPLPTTQPATGPTYEVQSQNGGGASNSTPPTSPVVATQPTNVKYPTVTSSVNAAFNAMTITWVGTNTLGYDVERLERDDGSISHYGIKWVKIATVNSGVTSFVDNVSPSHVYSYRVFGSDSQEQVKSIPSQIYTGPATDDKAGALKKCC